MIMTKSGKLYDDFTTKLTINEFLVNRIIFIYFYVGEDNL